MKPIIDLNRSPRKLDLLLAIDDNPGISKIGAIAVSFGYDVNTTARDLPIPNRTRGYAYKAIDDLIAAELVWGVQRGHTGPYALFSSVDGEKALDDWWRTNTEWAAVMSLKEVE